MSLPPFRARASFPSVLLASLASAQSHKISGDLAHAPGDLGSDVLEAHYAPDGQHLVYLTSRPAQPYPGDLFVVPLDGSAAPSLRNAGNSAFGLELDPSGVRAAYDEGRLWTVTLLGPAVPVALSQSTPIEYAFTPDGAAVVYLEGSGVVDLRVAPSDGRSPSLVLDSEFRMGDLRLSPDGRWAIYRRYCQECVPDMVSVRLDGSGSPLVLSPGPGLVQLPGEISADSSRAVFLNSFELLSVPLDGSASGVNLNPFVPSTVAHAVGAFHVSPDGTRVVFTVRDGIGMVLYSAPLDGSAAAVELSGNLAAGGSVSAFSGDPFQITPDGARVVYRADQRVDEVFELFAVPILGGPSTVLSGPLTAGGDVLDFQVSPDSIGALFRADKDADEVVELYAAPFSGGTLRLNAPLVDGGDVRDFRISADDQHVVYRADAELDERVELYRVSILGGPSTALSGSLVAGGNVTSFTLSPDSARVAFLADRESDQVFELYDVPLLGGAGPTKRSAPLDPGVPVGDVRQQRVTPDGSTVVYEADGEQDELFELYRASTAGGPVTKLSGPFIAGGQLFDSNGRIQSWDLTADGTRVVYLAEQETLDLPELFSAPLDGSGPAIKLNQALTVTGNTAGVRAFELTSDGSRVLYRAHRNAALADLFVTRVDGSGVPLQLNPAGQTVAGVQVTPMHRLSPDDTRVVYRAGADLYSAPLDGSAPAVRIDGGHVAGGGVASFAIAPDSRRVVFAADARMDERVELFSVPLDGRCPPTRLSAPLPLGGDVTLFRVTPSGGRVVYLADQEVDQRFELFSVPIDGARHARRSDGTAGPGRVKLNAPLAAGEALLPDWAVTPDGSQVFFVQASSANSRLLAAPADGSTAAREVATHVDGVPSLDALGRRLLYRELGRLSIFTAPVDGSRAPVRINEPLLGPPSLVREMSFSPDGRWVLFSANERSRSTFELFARPADGSSSPLLLNGPLAPGGHVGGTSDAAIDPDWRVSADSTQVVYAAEQGFDRVLELYATTLP